MDNFIYLAAITSKKAYRYLKRNKNAHQTIKNMKLYFNACIRTNKNKRRV